MTYDDSLDEIRGILEKTKKQEIDPELTEKLVKNTSISAEKMLLNYTADSPRIFHTTMKDIFGAHIAVHTKLSEGLKKAMPIMVIMVVAMVGVVGVSQLPMIIDQVGKTFGVEKRVEVERIQQVEVVYLTPDEARAQGIVVEDAPTGINPDTIDRGENAPQLNPVPDDVQITEDGVNNPRTEGFDIAGNLIPKPIPWEGGNNANEQKTCDVANGYTRHWVSSSLVPEEYQSDRSSQWLCLTIDGYNASIMNEPINATYIGTYEVRN